MCKWGKQVLVRVKIPADLSCSGKAKWKKVGIDSCIAPLVRALQRAGIDMRDACCGHRKRNGRISLQDGRVLIIEDGWIPPCPGPDGLPTCTAWKGEK